MNSPTLRGLNGSGSVAEQRTMDWHFILGGALVGFIVGATGVGGGSLMTPLLTLGFGVSAPVAVGTDLLFAAITKAGGATAHARRGSVSWPITGWLVAGSVPAAIVTLAMLRSIAPDATAFSKLITPTLGAALLLTATALVFKAQIQALGRRFATIGRARRRAGGHRSRLPAGHRRADCATDAHRRGRRRHRDAGDADLGRRRRARRGGAVSSCTRCCRRGRSSAPTSRMRSH